MYYNLISILGVFVDVFAFVVEPFHMVQNSHNIP